MFLPTAYLPPISWCSAFWNAETVVVATGENYQKGSFRNRAHLAGSNGVQRLSIPLVKGKHQQTPIQEVRISYEAAWQRQHWRTIQTAYGNAPYFEHYADALRPFYEKQYPFLFDFNLALIQWIMIKKLGWAGTLTSATFGNDETGHGAQEALSKWVTLSPPVATAPGVAYPQVFENKHGFIPNLSILDLFFCCGKHSGEILSKYNIPA